MVMGKSIKRKHEADETSRKQPRKDSAARRFCSQILLPDTPTKLGRKRSKLVKELMKHIDRPLFFFGYKKKYKCNQKTFLSVLTYEKALDELKHFDNVIKQGACMDFSVVKTFILKEWCESSIILRMFPVNRVLDFYESFYNNYKESKLAEWEKLKLKGLETEVLQTFKKKFKKEIKQNNIDTYNDETFSEVPNLLIKAFEWRDCGGCELLYRMVCSVKYSMMDRRRLELYNPLKLYYGPKMRHKVLTHDGKEECEDIEARAVDTLHGYISIQPDPSELSEEAEIQDQLKLLKLNEIKDRLTRDINGLSVGLSSGITAAKEFLQAPSEFRPRVRGSSEAYIPRSNMTELINAFLREKGFRELNRADKKEFEHFQEEMGWRGNGRQWSIVPVTGSNAERLIKEVLGHNLESYGLIRDAHEEELVDFGEHEIVLDEQGVKEFMRKSLREVASTPHNVRPSVLDRKMQIIDRISIEK